MNYIAYNRAYSLYPLSTLEHRVGLIMADTTTVAVSNAIEKYTLRGWTFVEDPPTMHAKQICKKYQGQYTQIFPSSVRWAADGHSWVISLPLNGVRIPAGLPGDPRYVSSWHLAASCAHAKKYSPDINCLPKMSFKTVKKKVFSNVYVDAGRKIKELMQPIVKKARKDPAGLSKEVGNRL